MYDKLTTDHPIDLTRYQVVSNYMGRAGLINSGGASGSNDLVEAVKTAVINKRAGGMGLISGRKAFQKPMAEAFAAVIAGVFLGWLSFRNGTIWMGLILHCTVAFSMDILALYNKGLLF